MTKRILRDDTGVDYEVDDAAFSMPAGSGPFRSLTDVATGERVELPESLFSGQASSTARPGALQPRPGYQDKLIEILLERCTLTNPGIRQEVDLLTGSVLAVGKIGSKEEYAVIMLEIENLVRSLYLSNAITEEESIYVLDQLQFFARWQARRSITYDGKPNERELWTLQSIHQKTEVATPENQQGGLMGGLSRIFGRGRY